LTKGKISVRGNVKRPILPAFARSILNEKRKDIADPCPYTNAETNFFVMKG